MKSFIGNTSSIGMLNGTRLVAYTSAVCLFVFLTLLAFPITSASEEATATTGTAVAADTSLTLSSTNDASSVAVTANSADGTFASSDANGTANFSVTTNNYTGYTLSISSSDDNGRLENYTHDYISSISSNLSEADFSNASNTTYNNKWGYKPNKYVNNNTVVDNTGSSSVFLPSPTTTPTVLNITSAANTVDDNYTIGLGIRADILLPSGVYSKTLNLIALANVVSYTINFNKNTEDTVTNMPTTASGTTSATGITIPNTTPVRTNYTFEGWCDTISPTGQCDGTTYQPNGSFGIDQTTENVTTLYAIWMPTRTMQNVYSWMNDLSINDSVQAKDTRDDKVYWVTKLETDPANPRAMIDESTGKSYQIWMTQNLDYDLDSNTALTPADSDVSANWTPMNSTLTDLGGWSNNYNNPVSYSPSEKYYYTSGSNVLDNSVNVDIEYSSLEECVNGGHSVDECMHYKNGNSYNWPATVASNDTSVMTAYYSDATNSVCPAGWGLPTGATSLEGGSDFGYLLNKNGVTNSFGAFNEDAGYTQDGLVALRSNPLWIIRAGQVNAGALSNSGVYGLYWSGTTGGSGQNNSFHLALNSQIIRPALQSQRYYGLSVRCIAKLTMQTVTADYLESKLPNVGDTTLLADERDGNQYPITRIDDNNFWMTSNLDLAGGTTITPADSNVATSYTLPVSNMQGFEDENVASVYNSNSTACTGDAPCYSYYNYVAATAGTNPSTGDAEYDICPKGWRLPTHTEQKTLVATYTGGAINTSPWNGSKGGKIYDGTFHSDSYHDGSTGFYWSSTSEGWDISDYFWFADSVIYATMAGKEDGHSVRCLFKKANMQDYSYSDLNSMLPNAGDAMDIYDNRDGKKYSIAKIADGNIWMTTNLNLAGGTTLTPDDSNVEANYTLPASSTSGFDDDASAFVYNSNNIDCSSNPCYSYYSYIAASAGTGENLQYGQSTTSDICPKGWRLPSASEYANLVSIYTTGSALTEGPWQGYYAGYYTDSTFRDGGSIGRYWSSNSMSYKLYFNDSSSDVSLGDRRFGFSVRCIAKTNTISNSTLMQSFSTTEATEIKSTMVENQQYTLTDARDNKQYSITKLSNGAIWMTSNLDIAGGTMLSTVGTNIKSSYYSLPASSSTGFSDNGAYVYNSDSTECGSNSPCYSYYSYAAATAGFNPSVGNTTSDICPRGWRLPTKEDMDDLHTLYSTSITLSSSPWNGNFGGGFANSEFKNGGAVGAYWTSTAYDVDNAYRLDFTGLENGTTGVITRNKIGGDFIRCVAKATDISELTTMQDFALAETELVKRSMVVDTQYTLTDARDNKAYTITKLSDGTIWMTTNLDLAGDTTITQADSNVASSYTLPASSTSGFNTAATANVYNSGSTTCGDNSPCYSYYNYAAATAGTNPSTGDSGYDICPKGWRLPNQAEYESLVAAVSASGDGIAAAPINGTYSGYHISGTFTNGGAHGNYWSSTAETATYAYRLAFVSGATSYVDHAVEKQYGFAVRCVVK